MVRADFVLANDSELKREGKKMRDYSLLEGDMIGKKREGKVVSIYSTGMKRT